MTSEPGQGSLKVALHNYGLPIAAVAFGTVVSIVVFLLALAAETESLRREFDSLARLRAAAIDNRFRLYDERTRGVRAFVRSTDAPQNLKTYVGSMLDRVGFEAMAWLPPSGSRAQAVVVTASGSAFNGVRNDALGEIAEIRSAFAEAIERGEPTISRPVRTGAGQSIPYVALVAPLPKESSTGGAVVGILQVSRVVDPADTTSTLDTTLLFDTQVPDSPLLAAGYVQPDVGWSGRGLADAGRGAAYSHSAPLPSTNGRWQVVLIPAPGYVLRAIGPFTWGALGGGLVITGLVGFAMFQQAQQGVVVSRRVEAATYDLVLSRNHLQAVFDTVVDGLITIDDKATVKSFNASAERIFGYRAEEVVGRNVRMLMPEPFQSEHDSYVRNYLDGGAAKIIGIGREVTARRKDGSVFPMELGVSVFAGGPGRSFVGIIRDIGERKAAQEALQDSRLHTQSIIDHAMDGIISIDRSDTITEWNAQAEAIFGWGRAEAVGRSLVELIIPPEYRDAHRQGMRRFLSHGIGPILGQRLELPALTRSGSRITAELAVTTHTLRGVLSFTAFVRDITSRKAVEAERETLIRDLKRSNQELDDFAYIASHDLKEPLRGLFNNARFLQEDYGERLDAEGIGRLERLGFLTQRMERLVNDLLYFSRLGRQELAVQYTDLNAVIAEISGMIETTLQEENAEIVIPQALPGIVCDRPRIAEVFHNLIVNAIKYNDKPAKMVEIGYLDAVKTSDGDITDAFYVKDNGIGIERDFYSEIFRIFKRLNEENDARRGSGVGLTFVKKIVERHGGRIWLESLPGRGTTFYFTIKQGVAHVQAA